MNVTVVTGMRFFFGGELRLLRMCVPSLLVFFCLSDLRLSCICLPRLLKPRISLEGLYHPKTNPDEMK